MGVLDQIMQMKQQGIPDEQIVGQLSQQGISPREINDALRQAQIKNAVSGPEDVGMQPSIMPQGENVPSPNQQTYEPGDYAETQGQAYAPTPEQGYQPQDQQYYQQDYGGGYAQAAGIDTDTIIEIADQIFSEKTKKIQKKVDDITESSALLKTKVEDISDRIKKIENIIDKLQIAILEKVGSYGKNLDSIKKEMSMMQNSFSKMISRPKTTKKITKTKK